MVSQKPYVELTFAPDGQVSIEAHGFTGKACSSLVDALDQAIAGYDRKVHLKPEFYLADEVQQHGVRQQRIGALGLETGQDDSFSW